MSKKYPIRGIASTTHVDKHGEKISREALEDMAKEFPSKFINVNHETTLPPIGIIDKTWVEKRDDGEFQLVYEGYLFEENDSILLPDSDVEGLKVTWDDIRYVIDEIPSSSSGQLTIRYDPRNFDTDEITQIVGELNELVDTNQGLYIRKSELPQPVIWVLVGFIGGHIASGFLARFGEVAADKMIELGKENWKKLKHKFVDLAKVSNHPKKAPDFIFHIPIPESETIIEGALENSTPERIEDVLDSLSQLYAIAKIIIERNKPNYFSQLKFLFNPNDKKWEINYFITQSNLVVKGPRYYQRDHPLRERYQKMIENNFKDETDAS